MAFLLYSAKNAKVRFGGVTLDYKKWEVATPCPVAFTDSIELDSERLYLRHKSKHNRRWRRRRAYNLAKASGKR